MTPFRSALAIAIAGAAAASPAAVVSSTRHTSSSETWNTAGIWSDTLAPAASNAYESNHILRTASSFAGSKLTITGSSGSVALKPSSTTISNLHMQAGSIGNYYSDNQTAALNGNLYVEGPITISVTDPDGRVNAINSIITGSATITTSAARSETARATVRISGNNATTFSGNWVVGGTGTGTNLKGLTDFTAAGAFGSGGDLTVQADGRVDFDYDYAHVQSDLVLDGVMVLDQALSFRTATINGQALAAGTYTFAALNQAFDAQFENGGTGSLTVMVPEPTVALAGAAGLGLLGLGRRRQA